MLEQWGQVNILRDSCAVFHNGGVLKVTHKHLFLPHSCQHSLPSVLAPWVIPLNLHEQNRLPSSALLGLREDCWVCRDVGGGAQQVGEEESSLSSWMQIGFLWLIAKATPVQILLHWPSTPPLWILGVGFLKMLIILCESFVCMYACVCVLCVYLVPKELR